MRNNRLFADGDLHATLQNTREKALSEINALPKDQFLSTTVDSLVEHFSSKYEVEPLVLHEDANSPRMDMSECRVDVSGHFDYVQSDRGRTLTDGKRFRFYYLFTGDPLLWKLTPSTFFLNSACAEVDEHNHQIIITLEFPINTPHEKTKAELDSQLGLIRTNIKNQYSSIAEFNKNLPIELRRTIEQRRKKLETLDNSAAAFGITLVKKPGMPDFKPVELKHKSLKPLPKPPATGYTAEPAIHAETYEKLLSIIRHAGCSFEGTPQSYLSWGEEALRDSILSHINVVYEGKATGETFRKYGKTDIRLEEESRSAFVAECKIWKGQATLKKTLEQLLDYLTWRDCKASLIFFNKDVAKFKELQDTVKVTLTGLPSYLRELQANQGEWRFVFKSKSDESREITVHVFIFDLFVAPERAGKKR